MDPTVLLDQNKRALLAIKELKAQLARQESRRHQPLAIVGMACRFPGGCRTPEQLWELLREGRDAVGEAFPARWPEELYDADPSRPGKIMTRGLGMIEDVAEFDPELFHISPREATSMDPQQRLLLQVAWEACEDAGIPLDRLHGSNTGIFIGVGNNDYGDLELRNPDLGAINAYAGTGNAIAMAAGRLAFFLGTQGPALVSDTACSSALVAVHQASCSLRLGESDLAVAGGVNLVLRPNGSVFLSRFGALSPTGRCRAFASAADGYVRADGCGVIVMKRLEDAQRDGDRIWAMIRGSALNHDGRSGGLTVPSGSAQRTLLEAALKNAAIEPHQLGYLEAHGTGTPLGDPIEMGAIAAVFGEAPRATPLRVGSVKSNLGHTEAAAGIAGLIKAALCLHHRAIPAHLHFIQPSAHIDWSIPIQIPTELQEWSSDGPRLAGVSSFGFSGTNAHVVLEEAPPRGEPEARSEQIEQGRVHVLCISARHERSLSELAAAHRDRLRREDEEPVARLCHAAIHRRSLQSCRLAVVGESREELAQGLDEVLRGEHRPGAVRGDAVLDEMAKVAFVFSGQGSQWIGMGRELLSTEPRFGDSLRAMDQTFCAEQGWSLVEALQASDENSRLDRTRVAQPAIVAVQLALSELWQRWGMEPDAVLGHSLGEISAACAAGAMERDEGLRLAARRGTVMDAATGGGQMAELTCAEDEAQMLLRGLEREVSIAASNGPSSIVISGTATALAVALERATAQGRRHRLLRVDYAFHSPQMAALAQPLRHALAEQPAPRTAVRSFYSSVRGGRSRGEELTADYWVSNMTAPVRFHEALVALCRDGHRVFVEIAPHPVLLAAIRQTMLEQRVEGVAVASTRRRVPERRELLNNLAGLHCAGAPVAWSELYPGRGEPVALPRYPWRNRRFWTDVAPASAPGAPAASSAASPPPASPLASVTPDAPLTSRLWRELLELGEAARRARLERHAREQVTAILRLDPGLPIPKRMLLNELGMDSVTTIELARALALDGEHRISPTVLFDHPTIEGLTALLVAEHERLCGGRGALDATSEAAPSPAAELVPPGELTSGELGRDPQLLEMLTAFEKEYS